MAKSYWQKMACRTDRDKEVIKSWFSPFCDDMMPESAEILCDIETDKEKKLRAVMNSKGIRRLATRTVGARNVTITLSRIKA